MIYLDNAASSHPKPPEVVRAVTRQLRSNGANPGRSGHQMAINASETVFKCRTQLADFFGAEPETVLFTANTTEAINRVFKGILRQGDHVLISDLEHNSVLRPLIAMRDRGIISFDVVSTGTRDEETAKNFADSVTKKTKLIFCTHASNVTGRILPIQQIGTFCREKGILFGVDGAQTAGTQAYNLKEDPVDMLCIPGHKGLLGPQGTGALLLAKPLDMLPLTEGGTGSDSLLVRQPLIFPDGYESGTLNTPGIAGLREGVRYVNTHKEKIRKLEERLRDYFLNEISDLQDFRIISPGEHFVSTISLAHKRDHSEKIVQWLDHCNICTRGGFHCSALAHRTLNTTSQGTVRISFGYQNTERDVAECVKCLKKY